jgi:LmbE family N-acetylglucosaminyl deacetylase
MKLLLAPHNDDETLFACWTLLRHRPQVIVCLRSMTQERHRSARVTYQEREDEMTQAMAILECEWTQLTIPDDQPDWEGLEVQLNGWANADPFADHFGDLQVWAPAWEPEGHPDHNMVADIAVRVFGAENVTHYMTYQRGTGHSQSEQEVEYEPEWLSLKLAALSCYQSQMREPSCRPWFAELLEMREWYADGSNKLA